MSKRARTTRRNSNGNGEGLIAALGCSFVAFAILVKLAFLALIAWGIFELVTWTTSK